MTRARNIVRAAASQVKNSQAKTWLMNDEFGGWEKQATSLIVSTDTKARELSLSEETQDGEISTRLAYLAVQAVLDQAVKSKHTKR